MAIAENLSHRVTRRELFGMVKKYAEDTAYAVGIVGEITMIGGLSKWGWEKSQADKLRDQVPHTYINMPLPANPDFYIPEKKFNPSNTDHELILGKASEIDKNSDKWGKLARFGFFAMIPGSGIITKRLINTVDNYINPK